MGARARLAAVEADITNVRKITSRYDKAFAADLKVEELFITEEDYNEIIRYIEKWQLNITFSEVNELAEPEQQDGPQLIAFDANDLALLLKDLNYRMSLVAGDCRKAQPSRGKRNG
jgi:hypothetical protein